MEQHTTTDHMRARSTSPLPSPVGSPSAPSPHLTLSSVSPDRGARQSFGRQNDKLLARTRGRGNAAAAAAAAAAAELQAPAEEEASVHEQVVRELKYFGIVIPPVPITEAPTAMTASDIDAAISKSLAPARHRCEESVQTPKWELLDRATYEERYPEVDASQVPATSMPSSAPLSSEQQSAC